MKVPENIQDRVQAEPGSITLPSDSRPMIWVLVGLLVAALCVGGAFVLTLLLTGLLALVFGETAFVVGVQLLSFTFMPGMAMTLIGGLLGWSRSRTPRPVTIAGPTAVFGGLWPPKPIPIEALTLRGALGRPLELRAGRRMVSRFRLTTRARGWSYDSVTWVAEQCAANAGVEWIDERPEAEWRRWESDPVFRGESKFDVRLEDNRTAFPAHHATAPQAPKHAVDVGGMEIPLRRGLFSISTLRMDGTTLSLRGRTYPLRDITRADVVFSKHKTKNSTYWRGKLQIVVRGSIKTLADHRCSRDGGKEAAYLHWIAGEILRQARVAQPVREHGSEADVPENIAAMVGRRSDAEKQTER